MSLHHSEAVSFANSYFALADGLVSGIEYFLAENVVLDWFGKTIKGRHNVAAFMSTHKVNSRHVFNDINASDNIGYNKKSNRRRRRHKTKNSNNSSQNRNTLGNTSYENGLNSHSTPLNDSISSSERSRSWTKSHCSTEAENDLTLELRDDSLSNVFKLENIQSTDIEEIEQRIRQISLEDKSSTSSPKRNCKDMKQTKNVSIKETSMEFVEAHGEILFSKKSRRQSGWSDYKLIPSSSTQTWRKPCKLQIAFSSHQACRQPELPANNNHFGSDCKPILVESQTKLLNLEQIIDLSNQLVPNDNDYSGYLRNVNTEREQEIFFGNFEEYLLRNENSNMRLTSQYINNHLVLQKIKCDDQNESQTNFLFNNLIHIIIYEGRSRCRANLSQKFI